MTIIAILLILLNINNSYELSNEFLTSILANRLFEDKYKYFLLLFNYNKIEI